MDRLEKNKLESIVFERKVELIKDKLINLFGNKFIEDYLNIMREVAFDEADFLQLRANCNSEIHAKSIYNKFFRFREISVLLELNKNIEDIKRDYNLNDMNIRELKISLKREYSPHKIIRKRYN